MRILLVNNFFLPDEIGGAEVSVRTLAFALQRLGCEVHILTLATRKAPSIEDLDGVIVHRVNRSLLGAGPTEVKRSAASRIAWHASAAWDRGWCEIITRFVESVSPDIVNTFNLAGLTTLTWRGVVATNLPLVHTLFGSYLICFRGPMFKRGRDCGTPCTSCHTLTRIRRRDSRLPMAVVGDSAAILERHTSAGYFNTVPVKKVINCGLDSFPEKLTVAAGAKRRNKLRIGFLGRLHSTKGIHVVVEAARRLRAGAWTIQVAGTGDALPPPAVRDELGDRIEFLGWQSTDAFLRSVDVLVVPSIWNDPLPRAVFEGFAYGIPVIGSRIGGIPEMVHHGRNGFLFEAGNASELAELLDHLIQNPALLSPMSKNCLADAQHFSAARMARDYLTLYREIIGPRSW